MHQVWNQINRDLKAFTGIQVVTTVVTLAPKKYVIDLTDAPEIKHCIF